MTSLGLGSDADLLQDGWNGMEESEVLLMLVACGIGCGICVLHKHFVVCTC